MRPRRPPRSAALATATLCALLAACGVPAPDDAAPAPAPASATATAGSGSASPGSTPSGTPSAAAAATPSAAPTSADPAAPFVPRRSDQRAIDAMLDRRARAVLARDEEAFLATVDDRDPRLLRGQRTLFANLARLRLAGFSYETAPDVLTPDPVRGADPGDPVLRVATVEHVRLADVLDAPIGNRVQMTYVRRDGTWLVGQERRPRPQPNVVEQPRPWFGGPVAVADRGELVVIADAADEALVDRLAGVVEAGVRADARLLGVEPDRRLLVDATSNGRGVRLNTLDDQEAAALYSDVWDVDPRGRPRLRAGGAVRVNPGLDAEQLTDDPGLVRHELTHHLLREYTDTAPLWASEGIAEYARWAPLGLADLQVPPAMWRRLREAPRELPTSGLFQLDPAVNYLLAQGAVESLVERGGTGRFLVLLERYRVEGATRALRGDELTEQLLGEVYGIGPAELEQDMWRAVRRLTH